MTIRDRVAVTLDHLKAAQKLVRELPRQDDGKKVGIAEGDRDTIQCQLASAWEHLSLPTTPTRRAMAARDLVVAWRVVDREVPFAINGPLQREVWQSFHVLVA